MIGNWPKSRLVPVSRSLVLFGLLYLYLWLVVEPCLICSCGTVTNFPVYYKDWPFFRECMSYPGGLLRYVCALLPQFFYYSWAGALVITGQAWAISACMGWFLRALGVPGRNVLRFVPALLVLVPYAQYSYHFPMITGALVSLLFGCLYIAVTSHSRREPLGWAARTISSGNGDSPENHGPAIPRAQGLEAATRKRRASRTPLKEWYGVNPLPVAVYLVLSIASYVVSAAAYLPFAGLCAIYELVYRRRYGLGVVYLAVAAFVPYVLGVLLFHVSVVNAYTDMLPISWQVRGWASREKMIAVVYALYLLPIVVALVWGLAGRVFSLTGNSGAGTDGPQPQGRKSLVRSGVGSNVKSHLAGVPTNKGKTIVKAGGPIRLAQGRLGDATRPVVLWAVELLLVLAAGGAVAAVSLDRPQKGLLAVHYYACQRRWPEVLQAARCCPDNYAVINAVDRALYHTGRLNRNMFAYPQHPEALMITGEDHSVLYWAKFDTLIDLGLMNLAEKDLTECMETFGEHPMILQRLATIDLAKGKIEAARIYLERLCKTLFFSTWAKDYLARLEADPTLAGDPQIQQLRAQSLRKDSTVFFFAREPMLADLAEQGSQNRMAFEYLMAWYMMTKKLEPFVQNLARLTEFGYTEVPPLYQEAAVIYTYGTKKPVPLEGLTEARRRIEHFSSVFNRYGRNKDAALGELAKDYAGSYFFYFVYASGSMQK
jgi:hypothetical protein